MNDTQIKLLKNHILKGCKNGCKELNLSTNTPCDCIYKFRAAQKLLLDGNFPLNHLMVEREKAFEFVDDDDKMIIESFKENIDYCLNVGLGLFCYGVNGVGKTTSAIKLVEDIAYHYALPSSRRTDVTYWFATGFDLFNSYYKNKIDFEYACESTILVIDDFGRESFSVDTSVAAKNQYYSIYDQLFRTRSNANFITIITSNIGINEIADKLSDSIKSILGVKISLECVHTKCKLFQKENCPIVLHKNIDEISMCKEKDHQCGKCINKINNEPKFIGKYKFLHFKEDKGDVRPNYEGEKWDVILRKKKSE